MGKNYRAELTGVFGDPVDGNPTGVMEEAGYQALGLNYRYITARVTPDDFPDAMKGLRAMHFRGVNLTMPHKITVLNYLDELSEAARIIGAVNTVVVREDGTLFGENTDGKGFVEALQATGEDLSGKNITVLGAGGAARAIAVECALAGAASITIVNRTLDRAEELADLVSQETQAESTAAEWSGTYATPAGTDILINATSIGLAPASDQRPDIDYTTVTPAMTVCDVVFDPADTLFLKEAEAQGAKTVNGLGMLARQGARNFTLWTGHEAPIDVLEGTLRAEFNEA
ncbi:shikimate dehydrogenase [Schaalia vaccimaxillae]|uniref:shikimate dehydrogenase n=1 Tax=Schaalia vaccimaxillae TaxID=183916 RepID=UPI0003B5E0D3|nr:shikimate dehydrogenase [Schaalia vaccimaxillae]